MSTTDLSKPFAPDQVQWRAGKVNQARDRSLAMAYVDARAVMARLDEAFNPEGWQDSYYVVDTERRAVQCTISALYPNPFWDPTTDVPPTFSMVSHADVGYPNGATDDEPLKSAYSDSFKRAAVKFGIGRDLYEIEPMWLPYDAETKRLTALPEFVVGKGWVAPGTAERPAPAPVAEHLATDAMRRKVFAAATAKHKTKVELKAISTSVVGKDSSTTWTYADVDKLLAFIADLAA
ncbi:MAG TPA: Rad52/Rad22 family DNA repair protein [Acidothermaceae bacterium]|nr:Rad52/Rad22 family DNA repair protein [Acidothermaceae bacterium]